MRAEIKCGEMLREMAEAGQREKGGRGPIVESQRATQLADLGLTKDESSRFQKAAEAPRKDVEAADQASGPTRPRLLRLPIRRVPSGPAVAPGDASHAATLERLRKAGLFQDAVRRMARLNVAVHWKAQPCDWAVPDFVIAFAGTLERAAGSG